MSHYIPSTEKYPIVYYVNLFYKFFIPAVLGPMIILVVMDFGRMMINRFKKPKPAVAADTEEAGAEAIPAVAAETEPAPEVEEKSMPAEPEEPKEPSPAEKVEESVQPDAEPEPSDESKPSDEEEESSNDR
jgi:hypothetical protein